MRVQRSLVFVSAMAAVFVFTTQASAQGEGTTTQTERYEVVKTSAGNAKAVDAGRISNVTVMGRGTNSEQWYGLSLPQQKLYSGIIPGVRDTMPHTANPRRARSNRLTWIGLQKMPDKTRVFVQTGAMPSYRLERGSNANQLVIVLDNTKISLANFWRKMDARYIPRSISSIRAYRKRRSGQTRVVIQLRTNVEFVVSSEGNYVYVDFQDADLEPHYAATVEPTTVYDDPD